MNETEEPKRWWVNTKPLPKWFRSRTFFRVGKPPEPTDGPPAATTTSYVGWHSMAEEDIIESSLSAR